MSKAMNIAAALQQLGLDNTATEADVKQAYKDLARIWHPDRFQNDERLGARTEAQIKLINEARSVAIAYLKKHGHFLHVGREYKTQRPREKQEPNAPPRKEQTPPKQKKAGTGTKEKVHQKKQKPPKRESSEKKSETKRPEQPAFESNFHMDQGALVIIFISLIMISFLFVLGSSLLNSSEDKVKKLTRKIEHTGEKSELRKEWDARRKKEAEKKAATPKLEPAKRDTFFTLGSDKEWVSKVQGPPQGIKGRKWLYGYSTITFGDGKVIGWKSSDLNPLKIGMLLDSIWLFPNPYFEVGSFKEEVIALQGTPEIIEGEVWKYGEASVFFKDGTVFSWENDEQNSLKAPVLIMAETDSSRVDSSRVKP